VRELENVIERSVIFCDDDFIKLEHLPEYVRPTDTVDDTSVPSGGNTLKEAVRAFERQFIQQTLVANSQNKEIAARVLGVSLSSLYRKIEELQIQVK
jgi:transcriptional regulator with PAS, ATPase and Fis domain